MADVVRRALRDARVDADEVDHVNAHGTATPQNDRAEARGFRRVVRRRARAHVPVTSIKSMIGHCLGAAGAGRGGGPRADRRARRHSADDQSHRNRSRLCRRRRRERRARAARALRRLDVARLWRQRLGGCHPHRRVVIAATLRFANPAHHLAECRGLALHQQAGPEDLAPPPRSTTTVVAAIRSDRDCNLPYRRARGRARFAASSGTALRSGRATATSTSCRRARGAPGTRETSGPSGAS